MYKGKSIWSIAIRSSIAPFLSLIAFFPLLLLRRPNLKGMLLCFIPGAIWIAGIYSAQRSYKAAYQQMTYGQGVNIGFLTAFFTALWTSFLTAGGIAWRGKEITSGLLEEQGVTLQTTPSLQESPIGLAPLYNSLWFVPATFMFVLIIGTLTSLVLSLFLRTKNNQTPSQYASKNINVTVCTKVEVYGVLLFALALSPS